MIRAGGAFTGSEPVVLTQRLRLEALSSAHLEALFPVLDDPALHRFIGGEPRTAIGLARWIEHVGTQEPPGERWFNWVVSRLADDEVVGTVQATVEGDEAAIAWVIGTPFQGHGYAKEASLGMAGWLGSSGGVRSLRASIHPEHAASHAVARAVGLAPTDELDDGEIVWRGQVTDP